MMALSGGKRILTIYS